MPSAILHHLLALLALGFLVALPACGTTPNDDDDAADDDDSATGDDDDATDDDDAADDDDATDDDDSAAPPPPAPPGSTLCGSGGPVSGNGISGVICTSPVEISSGATASSADGSIVWHPGPIRRIAAP